MRGGAVQAMFAAVLAASACACSACGKGTPGGGPNAAGPNASVQPRMSAPPDAAPAVLRDVALWANAKGGSVEDLASLATHEGAIGLVEAAAEPELRATAIRAMGYARGWAHLPFLAKVAAGKDDDEAEIALDATVELAARPRRAVDVEDHAELEEGCESLAALTRDAARPAERRIPALRALRMMPCPKLDLPTDLDAK
ncbi:MAG: hypothetical protein KF819_14770 [Labilithrix sp.]|nr:hypothetical protein [Labilithrix sp.]